MKKKLAVVCVLLSALLCLVATGCDVTGDYNVKVSKTLSKSTFTAAETYTMTDAEYAELEELYNDGDEAPEMTLEESLIDAGATVEKADGQVIISATDSFKKASFAKNSMYLTSSKFIEYTRPLGPEATEDAEADIPQDIAAADPVEAVAAGTFNYSFNKTVKGTNGALNEDGSVTFAVQADDKNVPAVRAFAFTNTAATSHKVTDNISTKYTKTGMVQLKCAQPIVSITVNGVETQGATYVKVPKGKTVKVFGKTLKGGKKSSKTYFLHDYAVMTEIGTNVVVATLMDGTEVTLRYVYDNEKPVCNIVNGKTYKSGQKITFKDRLSKIKWCKLDGRKIDYGQQTWKKGKHTLKLMDKAGNSKTIKFTIK